MTVTAAERRSGVRGLRRGLGTPDGHAATLARMDVQITFRVGAGDVAAMLARAAQRDRLDVEPGLVGEHAALLRVLFSHDAVRVLRASVHDATPTTTQSRAYQVAVVLDLDIAALHVAAGRANAPSRSWPPSSRC